MDEKKLDDIDKLIDEINFSAVKNDSNDDDGDIVDRLRDIHNVPKTNKEEDKFVSANDGTINIVPIKIDEEQFLQEQEHSEKAIETSEIFEAQDEFEKGSTIQIDNVKQVERAFSEEIERPVEKKSVRKKKLTPAEKRKILKNKKRKMRQRTFGHVLGGIILSICIVSFSVWLGFFVVDSALDFTGIGVSEFDVDIEIPEYATTEEVAEILQQHGIISNPDLFEMYAKFSKVQNKYLSGVFTLSSTMSYSTIIGTLQNAVKQQQTVTIRITEGMTAYEIAELLEENQVCRAEDFEQCYRNKVNEYSFEKRVLEEPLKFNQLEGYLFPDTYEFFVIDELVDNPDMDTSEEALVAAKKMYSNFNQKITIPIYQQINAMGLTLDEAITLASMVQAEAATEEDMLLVASVFLNRIHNSELFPNLQSDVTVIYVENNIRPFFDRASLSADFQTIADAYNTYVANGIPVGPICNPGLDAINAVLNAPETNYYYFCANEDTLEMYYASTIDEHEQNLIIAGLA